MEYSGKEKRRAPRVQTSTTARVWVGDEEISVQLVNLSALGILAVPARRLMVGMVVLMELSLPEHDALHLAAEVVREDVVDGHYAVGLQLKDLPEDVARMLSEFVRKTRQKTQPHAAIVR